MTITSEPATSEPITTNQTTPSPNGKSVPSTIPDAIPYKGDDRVQTMARRMSLPMLAMGLMSVAGGVIAGIVGGLNFGDFFSPSGVAADLGTGEAAVQVANSLLFFGIGLILAGITMTLVNVVRNLRDAGRDVQHSLGATPLQLAKPLTGKLTPLVMMMGVMIEVVALVLGVIAAVTIGGVDPGVLGDPAAANAADLADIGWVRAVSAWLPGLRMVGIAAILGSIVLTLTTIRSAIRFQGDRVSELASAG
jgi:hypothetical protein